MVAICARGEEALKEAANALAEGGTTVHAATVDASDGEALRAFVAEAVERFDGLDIVVHNTSASAGRGPDQWINSFNLDPSIGSSLKFLRRTPWARAKVESLYLFMRREQARQSRS